MTVPCSSCPDATRLKAIVGKQIEVNDGERHHPSEMDNASMGGGTWPRKVRQEGFDSSGGAPREGIISWQPEKKVTKGRMQCRACASGKEWRDLVHENRVQEDTLNAFQSHITLLQEEQAKLLSLLKTSSNMRFFKKGQILIEQGSTERQLMVVVEGKVCVEQALTKAKSGRKMKPQILCSLGPGQVVGELVFLKGGAASASVRSLQDNTSMMILPRAEVLDKCMVHAHAHGPNNVVAFYRFLALHLCEKLRDVSTWPALELSSKRDSTAIGTDDKEDDICKTFNIHASEYVTVPRHPAALVQHGKRPLWGYLTATQSYLCFGGDLFGQPTRFAFHFCKIQSIRERDRCNQKWREGVRSKRSESAYLEVMAEPLDDDDDESDACFLFLFRSVEERDLFAVDVLAAYGQRQVWKQV